MKRIFALAFLPLVLFALEPVNLIKDHSFEKDSELWQVYAGGDGVQDSAVANRHAPEKAYSGFYSAFCDTKILPGDFWPTYEDSAVVIQGFCCTKIVSDLDSLSVSYCVFPFLDIIAFAGAASISLYLNAGEESARVIGYLFLRPSGLKLISAPIDILEIIEFPDDTLWYSLGKPIRVDLEGKGIPSSAKVDSLVLMGEGGYIPPWRGQKIYWDDVRLMGYADYDVGVKEILSGDSIQPSMVYIPEARIKNFGRENAPEFSVIAEIWEGETRVYYDSLPWSLDSDTEDTVSFKELILEPPLAPHYTLTVRTVADPDECDEDDEVSQTLYYSAVAEDAVVNDLNLEVLGFFSDGVLRVSYALPYNEQGTLTLYDATGRRIERVNVRGSGKVEFASSLPSGVYLIRLEAGDSTATKKAVVLK